MRDFEGAVLVLTATDQAGNKTSQSILISFTNKESKYPDIEGLWGDRTATTASCDDSIENAIAFNFDSPTESGELQGTIRLSNSTSVVVTEGRFKGVINQQGKLTGSVEFKSEFGVTVGLVELTKSVNSFSGTIIYETTCDSGKASAVTSLSLISGLDLPPPPSNDSYEPNNGSKNATTLKLDNKLVNLQLIPEDRDWFKFEIKATQMVDISIVNQIPASGLTAILYNESLERIDYLELYSATEENYTIQYGYNPGIYFLEVFVNYPLATRTYSLELISKGLPPDKDFEPNDTFTDAMPIASGFSSIAYFMQPFTDLDWYTFTVDELSTVTASLSDVVPFWGTDYHVIGRLYDSKLIEMGAFTSEASNDGTYLYDRPLNQEVFPGKYYLKLESANSFVNQTYSLKFNTVPAPDIKYEPNDSFEQAYPIESGFSETLFLSRMYKKQGTQYFESILDKDIFKINMPASGLITMQVNKNKVSEDVGDYSLNFNLYDKSGARLQPRYAEYGVWIEQPLEYFVESGDYYIEVVGEIFTDFPAYKLSVETTLVPADIYEPNNDKNTAFMIPPNFSSETSILEKGEEDWFKFTLNQDSDVEINLKNVSGFTENFLYTEDLDYITNFVGKHQRTLEKGVYYMKIVADQLPLEELDTQVYQFSIASIPLKDNKYEPNDNKNSAHPIELDFNEQGLRLFSTQGDDQDWYTFSLDKPSRVSMVISGPDDYNSTELKIYNAFNTRLRSTQDRLTVTLDAGQYYLVVGENGFSNVVYNLIVSVVD